MERFQDEWGWHIIFLSERALSGALLHRIFHPGTSSGLLGPVIVQEHSLYGVVVILPMEINTLRVYV